MPLDDQPVIIDDDPSPEEETLEEVMKPLIVPEKIPKLDESVGGTCAVSMEQLVLRPVHPSGHGSDICRNFGGSV